MVHDLIDTHNKIYLVVNDDGSITVSLKGYAKPYFFEFANEEEFMAILNQFGIIRDIITEKERLSV